LAQSPRIRYGEKREIKVQSVSAAEQAKPKRNVTYFPREHGATAMVLTPIFCVWLLAWLSARAWRWQELALPVAAFSAMAAKDPAVLVLRARFIWKRPHPDAAAATRWAAGWLVLFLACTAAVLSVWPLRAVVAMSLALCAYAALAIAVNVKNLQRSTLFQLASGAALTSSALATGLTATGSIAPWCWAFWVLSMLQAFAGILVVHARLDARLALRGTAPPDNKFRRAAIWTVAVLVGLALAAAYLKHIWIAAALAAAVAGYAYDLCAQKSKESLQMPLKTVGLRSLALSIVFSLLLILGLM
jgi:hypothetical protein